MGDSKSHDVAVTFEGKGQDSEVVTVDLIGRAIKFCASSDFMVPVSSFELANVHIFRDLGESKSPEQEEQKLEYMQVFQKFQDLVEDLFEDFAVRNGSSVGQLFKNFRDTHEGRFLPLFQEEHENKWFCDLALSWLEYESFLLRMVNVARRNSMGSDPKEGFHLRRSDEKDGSK